MLLNEEAAECLKSEQLRVAEYISTKIFPNHFFLRAMLLPSLRDRADYVVRFLFGSFIAIGCFFVVWPFATAMSVAAVIAIVSWPLFKRVRKEVGGRNLVATLIMVSLLAILIVLPIAGLSLVSAQEIPALIRYVREWIASLMDKGLASNTINRKLSSIRTYYKFLLRRGEVAVDPLRKVTGPKKKKPLPVFLREGEMNRLLDDMDFGEGFEGCRDHMIIEMFYATGMRLSELIGLDDKDVDFSASLVKVTGKRNKQRLIPFDEELGRSMREYVNVRNEAVPVRSDAFFVRKNGKRLYRSIVACLVKRNLSKVVTVKKRSPHVLRHTFATAMLNNGADLGSIKELLGHESLATTEVYTHTTFEELKKVYNQAHPRA